MHLSEIQKIILNVITICAWASGILLSIVAVAKGRRMKEKMGISFKVYLLLVGTTEVFYTIGAVMILSAMGVNVMKHLAELRLWQFYQIMSAFDWTTVRIIGMLGWTGFVINRAVSFISPGYLLFYGGHNLPKYFYYSAWTEVGLETFLTALIFISLFVG